MAIEENHKSPTELDTFLPQDGSNLKDGVLTAKYKVQVASRDVENAAQDGKSFDPFTERRVPNPTTDCDTLTHLLKASLGTGILAMPVAFKSAGLVVGIFATILVAFVCTHCAYILVKCAHVLYYKTRKSEMSFADVAETAFATGPKWARPFAVPSRYLIQISLFVTYYGTCSVYAVIVAANLRQIMEHHMGHAIDERMVISMLILPMILLSWVPDLKYLAPVSMVANIFMGTGLGITFYYLVKDMEGIDHIPFVADIREFPNFFSITIFAMEAIGVVMPLENSMKTPQHFVGICGVLNKGMSGVTLIYILLGFLGYVRYQNETQDSITLNLPVDEIPAQIVKVLIALAVYCTFGLQFYVCLDIGWTGIKDRFQKKPLLANYVLRTVLVTGSVLLAVAVPTIGPFIGLIGAFCFSILGLLIPVFIETVTYWDIGFGRFNWVAMKNVIICIIGLLALVFDIYCTCSKDIMDPENVGKEAVVRVSNWLRGIWEMRRRTSPVQQWVDSLPSPAKSTTSSSLGSIVRQQSVSADSESASIPECTVEQVFHEKENYIRHSNMTVSTPIAVPSTPAITCPSRNVSRLARDPSFQSDSSHCSSVESLLELRKADPEAVLLNLGFGGCANSPQDNGPLSRIPKRFLQPSKLKGIAINDFVKHQQETSESLDSTSLGYRGLTGSPYVAPSEIVQKIMQRLREHENHELDAYACYNNNADPYMLLQQQEGRLSVLSPDNRQFLERPRSKSPDMRNKRMIIGQRSFAFGRDGDLIEINPRSTQTSQDSDDVFVYSDDSKETNQMGPKNHKESENNKNNSNANFPIEKTKPSLHDLKSSTVNISYSRDSTETVIPARRSINNNDQHSIDKNHNLNEPKYLGISNESPRRASEGSYDKTSFLLEQEGRRFSDGVMHSIKKNETEIASCSKTYSSRKKSLKRQPKIRGSTGDVSSNEDDEIENISRLSGLGLQDEKKCSHCGKVQMDHDDDEEESCCYRRSSHKCWREMERVLQKNKKLEDVVNKSRREMAEIRDMLSNVLSVRMEPGF